MASPKQKRFRKFQQLKKRAASAAPAPAAAPVRAQTVVAPRAEEAPKAKEETPRESKVAPRAPLRKSKRKKVKSED